MAKSVTATVIPADVPDHLVRSYAYARDHITTSHSEALAWATWHAQGYRDPDAAETRANPWSAAIGIALGLYFGWLGWQFLAAAIRQAVG